MAARQSLSDRPPSSKDGAGGYAGPVATDISPETLAVLVDRHREFLAFLEPRVGSRAAAEELLQAAFVKTLERGGEIRDGESAVAWFYRLLRNALVDFYRRRDAERRALERHAREVGGAAAPEPDLEDAVCRCLDALIPTLKDEYATILKLVEMEGAPVAEAAARLGVTPGNAAVRLHRARQALRARLVASCGTCAEHACLDCGCRRG